MLLDLAISLIAAGLIKMVINLLRYYRDHRCPTCNGGGVIPDWRGEPMGCIDCQSRGYIFHKDWK